ncbi:hypothetical protein HZC53_00435 [Candidatus Uhrbacteria bacterium]|nr:hypothetical protein [Candidatus Uhrbacteria bacterium]
MPEKVTCDQCHGTGGLCLKCQLEVSAGAHPPVASSCCGRSPCSKCWGWGQLNVYSVEEFDAWRMACDYVAILRQEVEDYGHSSHCHICRLQEIHDFLHSVLAALKPRVEQRCDCSRHHRYIVHELLGLFAEFAKFHAYNQKCGMLLLGCGSRLGGYEPDFCKLKQVLKTISLPEKKDPFDILFGSLSK